MKELTKYQFSLAYIMTPEADATLDETHFYAVSSLIYEMHNDGLRDEWWAHAESVGLFGGFTLSNTPQDRSIIHVNFASGTCRENAPTFGEIAEFERMYAKPMEERVSESGRLPNGVVAITALLHIQPWWDEQLPRGWHIFPMDVRKPQWLVSTR